MVCGPFGDIYPYPSQYWFEYILIYTGVYPRDISADHRRIISTSYWYIPVTDDEYIIIEWCIPVYTRRDPKITVTGIILLYCNL
jgi:hypothetical protein